MLHGFSNNWLVWNGVMDELADGYDMFAPTLPGHWGGPELVGPPTVSGFADFVEQVMDDAGLDTAHIAGNSLGGWLALELATRGRARSVIAIAPAGLWSPFASEASRVRRLFGLLPWTAPVGRSLTRRRVPIAARNAYLRSMAHRPQDVEPSMALTTLEAPAHCTCLRTALKDPAIIHGMDKMSDIRVPVTILFGERDQVLPPERYGRQWIKKYPNVAAKTILGVGHVPMLEAPSLIASEIDAAIAHCLNTLGKSA
ncbi:alpha/beta fold hydrolase [Nocardia neocaledoniensis]|uniref:alpha/beta fold hydrolase n=1 Tax=Nocardia neocaledoniensis TaxID=236511 RepID=UPI0024550DCA|nr:alpha/beta fold hydrolase [Nocardia neocaledoniensis]